MLPLETLQAAQQEKRILHYLLRHGQATRQALVQALGLSLLTVSKAVSALLEGGLIAQDGTVGGGMGRRKGLLKLNPDHRYVVGVDVGYSTLKLGLVRFDGSIGQKTVIPAYPAPIEQGIPREAMMAALADLVEAAGRQRVLGISASISGMVDVQAGQVLFCPNIGGFTEYPFASVLHEATGLSVSLDTSARCMALGESYFGAGVGVQDQVFLSIGAGSIAAGILCGGRLYRGADGFAGEIGHVRAQLEGAEEERLCSCGSVNCLELYATEAMAKSSMAEAVRAFGGYSPARTLMGDGPLTTPILAEAYGQGDPIITLQAERIAAAVGGALGTLVNLLNPALIALGGGFLWRFPALSALIEAQTRKACLAPVRNRLDIRLSTLGEDAPLLGGAMQMIRRYIDG